MDKKSVSGYCDRRFNPRLLQYFETLCIDSVDSADKCVPDGKTIVKGATKFPEEIAHKINEFSCVFILNHS